MNNKKFLIITVTCFLIILLLSFIFFYLGFSRLNYNERKEQNYPRIITDGEISVSYEF